MSQSREEWAEIADGFASKWNCPHCRMYQEAHWM